MLRQERTEDPSEALRLALAGWQSEIWTAMPGMLDSIDLVKNTCVVQPTIKGIFRQPDGSEQVVTLPLCLDVPLQFLGGGGFSATFPMKKDDEGLLVFASRCIDAWWQNGGIQPQAEIRMHNLSDGFFIPGFRSQPRKLVNISATSAQLRNDAGDTYVEVKDGQLVNVVAPGGCNINGVTIDTHGNIGGVKDLTTTGDASLGGGGQFVKLADGSNATKVKAT